MTDGESVYLTEHTNETYCFVILVYCKEVFVLCQYGLLM